MTIKVADNGISITAEARPHVLDLLMQDTRTLATATANWV